MGSAPGGLIASTCDFKEYVETHCMRLYKNIEIPKLTSPEPSETSTR